jgi:hypothetical protein
MLWLLVALVVYGCGDSHTGGASKPAERAGVNQQRESENRIFKQNVQDLISLLEWGASARVEWGPFDATDAFIHTPAARKLAVRGSNLAELFIDTLGVVQMELRQSASGVKRRRDRQETFPENLATLLAATRVVSWSIDSNLSEVEKTQLLNQAGALLDRIKQRSGRPATSTAQRFRYARMHQSLTELCGTYGQLVKASPPQSCEFQAFERIQAWNIAEVSFLDSVTRFGSMENSELNTFPVDVNSAIMANKPGMMENLPRFIELYWEFFDVFLRVPASSLEARNQQALSSLHEAARAVRLYTSFAQVIEGQTRAQNI